MSSCGVSKAPLTDAVAAVGAAAAAVAADEAAAGFLSVSLTSVFVPFAALVCAGVCACI